jgi:protein-S-isoprenylcysteine O-methyltransferase Ste14
MNEQALFTALMPLWIGVAVITFLSLFFITAPYGRHGRTGWGPLIPSWAGWMLMEAPSLIVMVLCFLLQSPALPGGWVFLGLWAAHYVNRSFIYPLRNPGRVKPMPLSICGLAIFFNLVNAYLNGRSLTVFGPQYDWSWFSEPTTLLGLGLWALGVGINLQSDQILFGLRRPGETGYRIPQGGLYRWVSCPNYLGELVEWTGFALAAASPAAWTFVVWTAANLVPRAVAHHRWYRERFADYPAERKALVPFVL